MNDRRKSWEERLSALETDMAELRRAVAIVQRLEQRQSEIIGTLVDEGIWEVDSTTGRSLGSSKGGGAVDPVDEVGSSGAPSSARTGGTDRGECRQHPLNRPEYACTKPAGHEPPHRNAHGLDWWGK